MAIWSALDGTTQTIIQVGAAFTVVTAAYVGMKKLVKRFAWLVADHDDHEFIREQLTAITKELRGNGKGSMLKLIEGISDEQKFITSYLRTLLHTNDKPIVETDAEGKIIQVNQKYVRMTGFSADEVMGMGFVNALDPASREHILENWFHAVRATRNYSEDFMMQRPDGKLYKVHCNAYAIKDSEGKLKGYLAELMPYEQAA